jgi:hypothetical protein
MVTEIFINNSQIDLSEDLSVPLNYAIADIREPQKRNTNFSKTVVIPGTSNNNVLFSHIWDIGVNLTSSGGTNFTPNFNPNLKADVLVLQDGNEVFKGFAKLDNIVVVGEKVEYELSFYGNLANIFTTIGESKLSEIDLSEYDHTYTRQNQVNSWDTSIIKNGSNYVNFSSGDPTGEGYLYPLIDYGNTNGSTFDVKHFYPAVYVKTIVDKIFAQAGFQYSSNFFNSAFFKRLVIPFTGTTLKISQTQIQNREFRASGNAVNTITWTVGATNSFTTMVFDNDTTAPNNDPGNNYDTSTYKFTSPFTGNYLLSFNVSINVKHNNTVNNDTILNLGLGALRIRSANQIYVQVPIVFASAQIANAVTIIYSGTITTGSTSPTTLFNIQALVNIPAGTQVWCEHWTANVTSTSGLLSPYTNGGGLNINIDTNSYFSAKLANTQVTEGDNLEMNNVLPENIKQSEFMSSLFKMFNLYVDQDETITNKLVIEPRDDYFASSGNTTLDWSYKLDYSKAYETKPMGDLESKTYIFTYKDDNDYYNELYKKKFNETYGYKDYEIENDFLKSEIKNELIFSPTPLADYIGIDRIIPKIFIVDNNGQPKPKQGNIRILYYGGVKTTTNPYSYVASSGTTNYTTYPYVGHLDDPLLPTLDINFGAPVEVFYTTQNYTNNNLFNKYWKKFIQEISDINSKIFTGYFYLTPLDIAKLDFKNFYYFEGEYWRLNRIFDYNPNQMSVTKCEFIKLIEYPTFEPTNTTNVGDGIKEDDVTGWYNTQRTGTVQGGESLGENIFIHDSTIGAKVSGSDIYIAGGTKGVSVLGSSGVTVAGGVEYTMVLGSSGTTVTQSGALYINGLAVKDTGSGVRVKSVTANYDAVWSDTVLLVNASGGNITINLPDSGFVASAKDEMGKLFYIKKVDASANTVTIDGYSTQTIDGAGTYVINTQYDSVTIVSDGSNYHIV